MGSAKPIEPMPATPLFIESAIAQWDAVTDDLIWIDGLKGTYWGIFTRASVDLLSWLKYLG